MAAPKPDQAGVIVRYLKDDSIGYVYENSPTIGKSYFLVHRIVNGKPLQRGFHRHSDDLEVLGLIKGKYYEI